MKRCVLASRFAANGPSLTASPSSTSEEWFFPSPTPFQMTATSDRFPSPVRASPSWIRVNRRWPLGTPVRRLVSGKSGEAEGFFTARTPFRMTGRVFPPLQFKFHSNFQMLSTVRSFCTVQLPAIQFARPAARLRIASVLRRSSFFPSFTVGKRFRFGMPLVQNCTVRDFVLCSVPSGSYGVRTEIPGEGEGLGSNDWFPKHESRTGARLTRRQKQRDPSLRGLRSG
jgi:hypothetical protein